MQSTTTFRRGDVVLVPFRYADLTGGKLRPALVLSVDRYHHETSDVLLAQITGRSTDRFGDYVIADWHQAGLRAPSRVRATIITTDQGVVQGSLGHLPAPEMAAVEQNIRDALGL